MSVCSTSHADMLYVNRIYVCIVNIKLEITYGLCIPTYLQCPFPSYLCYSAYPSAQLGYAVRCCHGLCAGWLAQRPCKREWEFLIPTSGRTMPTWGGVVSPGDIPARGTHSQGHGSRAPPWSVVVHTLSDCRYDISHLSYVVELIFYTGVMCILFAVLYYVSFT